MSPPDGMAAYYFGLALRSLRRNLVLTLLMIGAIGVGIGASMTVLTVFRAMDSDPIPAKSSQLFAVQIDNWGPSAQHIEDMGDQLEDQLSYTDAMGMMQAHAARRQAAFYATALALTPDTHLKPFKVDGRATFADFFPMFEVPFSYGTVWTALQDDAGEPVVVISHELNQRLFGGRNSVGRTINLDDEDYRIVGVMGHWSPVPRFYDLTGDAFSKGADVFLPFKHAIDRRMSSWGETSCSKAWMRGWEGLLASNCAWIQFWVELPTPKAVQDYGHWLQNYAALHYNWPPRTKLRDVRAWLTYEHVVSNEARMLMVVAFSFLLVCVLNACGLMLAKFMGRASDIGVRRALGASRGAIMAQCLIEAAVVGLAGGVLGLALTALGLMGLRSVLSEQIVRLTHSDLTQVGIALALAIVATLLAGLYPSWRAAHVQPAWQLKAQ
jgi:putative ABC transport system permease protein